MTFRFFNSDKQDDEVASEMRSIERRFLRATDMSLKSFLEAQYAELEAWFAGNGTRLTAAVTRVQGR